MIQIEDIDDTAPIFYNPEEYTKFRIEEFDGISEVEFQVYTIYQTISIIDEDSSSQEFVFSLSGNDGVYKDAIKIVIDTEFPKQVKLNVTEPIDREDPALVDTNGFLTFMLNVEDQAGNQASTELKIQVDNVNDCKPIFNKIDTTTTISELSPVGTFLDFDITAVDDDAANDPVSYKIKDDLEDAVFFDIDSSTGQLKTSDESIGFDYDSAKKSYIIIVAATDRGGLEDTLQLTIKLSDENDNAPIFKGSTSRTFDNTQESLEIDLMQDADDKDSENNGNITFMPTSGQHFSLDENGVLSVFDLLEKELSINFTLQMKDLGEPPMTSEAYIFDIKIQDVNDKVPIITYPTEEIRIYKVILNFLNFYFSSFKQLISLECIHWPTHRQIWHTCQVQCNRPRCQ